MLPYTGPHDAERQPPLGRLMGAKIPGFALKEDFFQIFAWQKNKKNTSKLTIAVPKIYSETLRRVTGAVFVEMCSEKLPIDEDGSN